MRSVIRGKILEGRCGFGTEEQRTSGKKEYVVDGQLRALCTQLFQRRQISERFFSHLRIFHISIQVLNQTWTKKKRILGLQATTQRDFARRVDKPQLTRQEELRAGFHASLKRFHENIDSIVITPAKCCSLNYLPFQNQSKKTEYDSISVSLV